MNNSENITVKIFLWGISLLVPFFTFSQNLNVPLNQTFLFEYEQNNFSSEQISHISFKPFLGAEVEPTSNGVLSTTQRTGKSWVSRKLFHEHFITLDTGIVKLTIDPLVNFEFGRDSKDDPRGNPQLYKNIRGFNAKLQLGNKVALESSFRENQAVLPYYLSQQIRESGVAYGQGRTKTFGDFGYDFAMASAYVSYTPIENVNIQFGHGKHFLGEGHRSLLLSDVSFNYPFLRLNTSWFENKLSYQNLFASLQDLNRLASTSNSEGLFERKSTAMHYLEYSPNTKFSVGLFEKVIFPTLDSTGNKSLPLNYFLPSIGVNTALEAGDYEGNSLLGLNAKYLISKKIMVFTQLAAVNDSNNSIDAQFGLKLSLHKNLLISAEANIKNSGNVYMQSHYNESMTTPIVYESTEFVGTLTYKKNRWLTRGIGSLIDGEYVDVYFLDFRQAYIVNHNFNFTLHVGAQIRMVSENEPITRTQEVSNYLNETSYFYVGLSTNLQNLYFNY